MRIYLNPGNENFKEITKVPLYVDKTMMIQTVNQFIDTGNKYVCVSRPCRFGKTVTSNRGYNNEDALQSAIYLAYIYALNHYAVIREMTSGKGFADVVFIPFKDDSPAMIIELKRNDCARSAIEQIKNRQHYDSLSHYTGNLLFVGINYDEKEKSHTCRIERFYNTETLVFT